MGRPPNRGQGQAGGKALLLCKGDLHGVVLGNLEALQGVASSPCLHLIVKLHEGDVVPPRDQPDLLEAREPERRKTDFRDPESPIPPTILSFGGQRPGCC